MTCLKQILVHVEGGARDASVLKLAEALAKRFDARIEAVFANVPPFVPASIDGMLAPQIIEAQRAIYARRANAAQAALRALTLPESRLKWTNVDGLPADAVVSRGRLADLTVIAQPSPEESDVVADYDLPADAVMALGRPILVVPYAGTFTDAGKRILVAWRDSRESARALADALPFLAFASEVTVIMVNPEEPAASVEAGLSAWFAAHGIKSSIRIARTEEIGVSDVLLSAAADLSADLIVMGAYGRSRLRELVLGGATHGILKHMTAPVLMSH